MDSVVSRHDTNQVRGRVLRFLITRELRRAHRPMAIGEIIERLEGYGFTVLGRASKTVSDCLRWEIAKGRVRRMGRGIYAYGFAPRSTLRRIDLLSESAKSWIVALTRTPQPQTSSSSSAYVPKPWDNYTWLWRI